ncbi:MAG TPA: hypothetical protein VOA78_03980 [Candidatus Dormibacteraeota bacterium]|nr:hypothetical protein [Candidatus Dormibacteraeota bacterium]
MTATRRSFLRLAEAFGAVALFSSACTVAGGQNPPPPRSDPRPRERDDDAALPPAGASKAVLQENEKDIKKSIEKLFQLASELKAEVEKTDSSQVLSIGLVRKAEEIEKLAKEIKTRAKG